MKRIIFFSSMMLFCHLIHGMQQKQQPLSHDKPQMVKDVKQKESAKIDELIIPALIATHSDDAIPAHIKDDAERRDSVPDEDTKFITACKTFEHKKKEWLAKKSSSEN